MIHGQRPFIPSEMVPALFGETGVGPRGEGGARFRPPVNRVPMPCCGAFKLCRFAARLSQSEQMLSGCLQAIHRRLNQGHLLAQLCVVQIGRNIDGSRTEQEDGRERLRNNLIGPTAADLPATCARVGSRNHGTSRAGGEVGNSHTHFSARTAWTIRCDHNMLIRRGFDERSNRTKANAIGRTTNCRDA